MNVLVTGGTGLIGTPFVRRAINRGHNLFVARHKSHLSMGKSVPLDLLSTQSIESSFKIASPDIVVHLAAITDLEKCESDKEEAKLVNAESCQTIAKLARNHNSFLIYLSTDYVFDGHRGSYAEEDEPNPINWYGRTKFRGEQLIAKYSRDYCIARTSTPFGAHKTKKTFPLFVVERLRKKLNVQVAIDQFTSPTSTENLANMLMEVLEKRLHGIYHLAGRTRASRLQVAEQLARHFDLDESLIEPKRLSEFKWRAKRPKDSSLNTSKAFTHLENKPYTLVDAINSIESDFS